MESVRSNKGRAARDSSVRPSVRGLPNRSRTDEPILTQSRRTLTSFPIILMVGATVEEEVADGGAIVAAAASPVVKDVVGHGGGSASSRTDSLSKLILTWDHRWCESDVDFFRHPGALPDRPTARLLRLLGVVLLTLSSLPSKSSHSFSLLLFCCCCFFLPVGRQSAINNNQLKMLLELHLIWS